jgi:hypothetical protein
MKKILFDEKLEQLVEAQNESTSQMLGNCITILTVVNKSTGGGWITHPSVYVKASSLPIPRFASTRQRLHPHFLRLKRKFSE